MTMQELFFSFSGRINRATFWTRAMPILFVYGMITNVVALIEIGDTGHYGPISIILSLIGLWPNLAVLVKRLHDRSRSGWFIFIALIPVVGPIWLLVEVWFLASKPETNRFGDIPTNTATGKAVALTVVTIVLALIVAMAVVLSVVDFKRPTDFVLPEAASVEPAATVDEVIPDEAVSTDGSNN